LKEEDYPLSVGVLLDLWDKAKKEVKEGRIKKKVVRGLRVMPNKSELPLWAVLLRDLIEEIEEEQEEGAVKGESQ
jgi:hypothetical protein